MAEKVRDLLSDKEKIEYYELLLRMHREKDTLSNKEHNSLYKQASKILLHAVDKEIDRRKSIKTYGQDKMKRLFNLFLVFLKTEDEESRNTIKYELELLTLELKEDSMVSEDVKRSFGEILQQYKVIYETDGLIERYEAEERVKKLIEELKERVGFDL